MKQLLTKGQGIIVTGQDIASKMALAVLIADPIGFYAVADFKGINGPFNSIFLTGSEVIIVTQFDPTPGNLDTAKALVSNDDIVIERKGYSPQTVELPLFIFVTNGPQVIKQAEAGQGFTVIRMGGPNA